MNKIFSIPLNPKLTANQFDNFTEFLKTYKDYIYDIYFTCRMPPFIQDAMGDVFQSNDDHTTIIDQALHLSKETDIPLSATFNNTLVRPTQQNLDLWINNFKQLYETGVVSSATIPHTHWVATKLIQHEFPDLEIKNTILRNVTEPREVVKLGEAGFHYVNIDRDLMRDRDRLIAIKRAKEFVGVKISLLANEGCLGNCPMMDEHYEFNNSRSSGPQYFNDPISRTSCPKWDYEDPSTPLKTADFPPWREDWDELLEYIDVIKMHGREAPDRLNETMHIIKNYAEDKEILFDTFNEYIEETNLVDAPINVWRKKIKTCKFECWDCGYCDKVYNKKSGMEYDPKITLVTKELIDSVYKNIDINIPGLTAQRVLNLINALAKESNHYLEIGSFHGATTTAALLNNDIKVSCVDNWVASPQAQRDDIILPENSKEAFTKNIKTIKGDNSVTIFDCDLFEANTDTINDVDLFYYDGPHDPETTKNALVYYSKTFANTCICIFDDANWEGVVHGANEGIQQAGLKVLYNKKILNDVEDKNSWWNGLYITILSK
jgi:hypothetical protein